MNEHCRDLHRKFYMKVNMKRIIFKKCVSFGNNGYSHVRQFLVKQKLTFK